MRIRTLTPNDVELYRPIRLRALATDPGAFGSTYERELGFDDATWRARLSGPNGRPGVVHLAIDDRGASAGIAGIGLSDDEGDAMLWGMWVDPAQRGTAAASMLVQACVDWAIAQQLDTVTLDVVRTNERAQRLYARFGFEPTGRTATLASDPCAAELEMRRRLR